MFWFCLRHSCTVHCVQLLWRYQPTGKRTVKLMYWASEIAALGIEKASHWIIKTIYILHTRSCLTFALLTVCSTNYGSVFFFLSFCSLNTYMYEQFWYIVDFVTSMRNCQERNAQLFFLQVIEKKVRMCIFPVCKKWKRRFENIFATLRFDNNFFRAAPKDIW